MTTITAEDKLINLKNNIKKYSKAIIAFSGGVDSTFLLAVCAETLGKSNVVAVTASSDIYTESELCLARETAAGIRVPHEIIETDELNDPVFLSNPSDRCYYCKKSFYSKVLALSEKLSIRIIFDGSNADDASDYRPGRTAAREFGIISPFMEAGLSKDDIRLFSQEMNLPTWDKPANPCLASRIPYGSRITKERLETIARAEAFIRDLGFNIIRVRHHDAIARIELPVQDMTRFMQNNTREQVNQYLKSLGFVWVAVDIGGYKTGSLNSVLGRDIDKDSSQ